MESDRFYRRMLKLAKEPSTDETRFDRIREAFVDSLPELPGEMANDLFADAADILNLHGISTREDFLNAALILTRTAELFWHEYGTTEGELPPELWEAVRDCIRDYAEEIDEDLLEYCMSCILDQGKI